MALNIFVTRLLASMIAGGLVGLERQRSRKSAGIRTNTLVAIGACMFVLVSVKIAPMKGADPTRIISQIVTGIGFLGAGVILQHKGTIRGLTTAATVWCSAALGVLSGMGMFWELAICTGIIWFVNTFLKTDRFLENKDDNDDENEGMEYKYNFVEEDQISENDEIID